MSWIKQNKFLSGFLAFMVIGVGALGYLLMQAQSHYSEVRTDYETKAQELNRLETLKPYPEAENLKLIEAQKAQQFAVIEALHKNLAAAQLPTEQISREQFQDKLREAVTRVTTKAKEGGIALPAMFYLGMDKYQSEPPLPEAAPALGRQLNAVEFILTKLLDAGVVAITKFDRDALPEEEGKGKKDPAKQGGGAGKAEKSAKNLVSYHGMQIEFTSDQGRFRNILNEIVTEKGQFYVPRLVVVKNEKEDAPARFQPGVAGAEPPKPGAASGTKKLVFGSEKVNVSLVLDVVDFAEVAAK